MYVFHQPLPVLEDMDVDELLGWAEDAQALLKEINRTS